MGTIPKRPYGSYCWFNPVFKFSILAAVSFLYITSLWVSLLFDHISTRAHVAKFYLFLKFWEQHSFPCLDLIKFAIVWDCNTITFRFKTEISSKAKEFSHCNHTSCLTVLTPTDRPKSVSNHCVIGHFDGRFVLWICLVCIFFWYKGSCHWTESDLFPFLFTHLVSVTVGHQQHVMSSITDSVLREYIFSVFRMDKKRYITPSPLASACFVAMFCIAIQSRKTLCLAKDHWWRFNIRNLRMNHIVNSIWFMCCIHLSRSILLFTTSR